MKETLVSFKIKPSNSSSKGTYSFLSNRMESKVLGSRLTRCTCNLPIKFTKNKKLKYSFCIKCSFFYVKKTKKQKNKKKTKKQKQKQQQQQQQKQPSLIFILLQRTLWRNWWQLLLIWHLPYLSWPCAWFWMLYVLFIRYVCRD